MGDIELDPADGEDGRLAFPLRRCGVLRMESRQLLIAEHFQSLGKAWTWRSVEAVEPDYEEEEEDEDEEKEERKDEGERSDEGDDERG